MDKDFSKNINKMLKLSVNMSMCSSKKCEELKIKLAKDKQYLTNYLKYKTEINAQKKEKLLEELSNNELLYKYNKCIIKNCKKISKQLLHSIKLILDKLPKNHPKYKELHKMIHELKDLYNIYDSNNITKEQNKVFLEKSGKLFDAISKI